MQRKLALLVLTLAILALAFWFLLSRGANSVAPLAKSSPSSEAGRPAATPAVESESQLPARAQASARTAIAARLHVRSSAAIPLAFVEIERGGAWERVELVGGECDASAVKLPATIRAPGHVAKILEKSSVEVVLDPEALLVIEGDQLRSCLAELAIEEESCRRLEDWRQARTRAIAADWVSATRFGIAVACDRLEPLPSELHVEFVRADRKRLHLGLAARPRLRARWEMPCGDTRAGTPLEVRVDRPAGRGGPVLVLLECASDPGSAAPQTTFDWGSVSEESSELVDGKMLAEGEAAARFPVALSGRRHVLAALDESTHAYGRLEFVHDGSPRTITLREAFEIRGRVVDSESHAPLRSVNLLVQGLGVNGWTLNPQPLKVDETGAFVLRAPGRPPTAMRGTLDPPNKFTLEATQAGYGPTRLRFARNDPRVLDVGEVLLVRHKNPIVLAAGHGVRPGDLDGHCTVFADKPEEQWRTLEALALEDGRLEVSFSWSKTADPAKPVVTHENLLTGVREDGPFDRALGAILFVHVVDDVRSFRLESDGLYHRLPEQQLALTLRTEKLAAGDKDWVIGWTWNGAWSRVGKIASRVPGEERDVRVTIPSGAQQLWWSSSAIPPDLHGDPGGFQAITGSSMKVVLR